MMKTKTIALTLAFFAACVVQAHAGTIVVKAAHTGNVKQKYHAAMEKMRDLIEERTGGRFKVEIFPGSLGGDRELIEGLQIGTVDMAEMNTSVLATITPRLGVYDLPYIFRDAEHADRVLDGEIGTELMLEVQNRSGIIGLGYWENGFRCFTNNVRSIRSPADLKGLKMRSMQNAIHLDTFVMWGANPTPMSFGEMITAMQQGVIDGHDNAADTVAANSLWEVQRHFTQSQHFYAPKIFGVSPMFWGRLSPEDKKIFQEAYYEVRDYERRISRELFDQSLKTLAENGMRVVPIAEVDIEAFQNSVQPIWDKYAPKIGADLIKRIHEYR